MVLVAFKLIMDYSFFGQLMLLMNLRIFIICILFFYLTYLLFLPYLIRQQPLKIAIIVISLIVGYVALMIYFMPKFPPKPIGPPPFPKRPFGFEKRFPDSLDFHDIFFKIGIFSTLFSTLIFFVDKWMENQKMIKVLEFERQSSELKILREQINPHFFFNALNSIYSLSVTQSKETSRVILILSDIMRYVLNDKIGRKNNLNDEVVNLKKYIEIQSIRFSKFDNIDYNFLGNFNDYKIEPLLLLTFVENAFKYADFIKGPVKIRINLKNEILNFSVKNSYEKKTVDKNSDNKLGIKNTKMKLDLLYPAKYQLDIDDTGSEYIIRLELKLDKNL